MLRTMRDAGLLSPAEFQRRRAEELERYRAAGMPPLQIWMFAYAWAVDRVEDAAEALAAKPATLDAQLRARQGRLLAGRIELLAGDPARAKELLSAGLASCSLAAGAPRDYLRGKLALGQASERLGDMPGACQAYRGVIERWGKAIPKSVTAVEAHARATALGCPTEQR